MRGKLIVMALVGLALAEVLIIIALAALPGAAGWEIALFVLGEYVVLGALLWLALPRRWRRK